MPGALSNYVYWHVKICSNQIIVSHQMLSKQICSWDILVIEKKMKHAVLVY